MKGKPNGSKISIPLGGHVQPIPIEGAKLAWKNAQKKLKKNITSEVINNIKPIRKPLATLGVWLLSQTDSLKISLNQKYKPKLTKNIEKKKLNLNVGQSVHLCNAFNTIITKYSVLNDTQIGQGLGVIKWNGCFCVFIFLYFVLILSFIIFVF